MRFLNMSASGTERNVRYVTLRLKERIIVNRL
nr:MAG TPA_asm: hypothetical protein [Caudoviricetes sp.]